MSKLFRSTFLMSAIFMGAFVSGCSDEDTPQPAPPGSVEGPQRPKQPEGAEDAMKNSLKKRPTGASKPGQSGQVPH
jgi:hypothetical protein